MPASCWNLRDGMQWTMMLLWFASTCSVVTSGPGLEGDWHFRNKWEAPAFVFSTKRLQCEKREAPSCGWSPGKRKHAIKGSFRPQNENDPESSRGPKMILPVFPLRKAVKLPSEMLTLNLYEERYLALAEYVLQGNFFLGECETAEYSKEQRYFGALYCSSMPQMIRDGVGPIVPMVEKGDIGVICSVVYDEEGMVPTSASAPGENLRRRIKLLGLAVGRFSIDKVLHNGYGNGEACEAVGDEPLPFILVEASLLNDIPPVPGSEDENQLLDLERQLHDSILKAGRVDEGTLSNQSTRSDLEKGLKVGVSNENCVSLHDFAQFLPSELQELQSTQTLDSEQTSQVAGVQNALQAWEHNVCESKSNDQSVQTQRRQFFSFVAALKLIPTIPTSDMVNLLELVSTRKRLEYIREAIQGRSWLSNMKKLSNLFKR